MGSHILNLAQINQNWNLQNLVSVLVVNLQVVWVLGPTANQRNWGLVLHLLCGRRRHGYCYRPRSLFLNCVPNYPNLWHRCHPHKCSALGTNDWRSTYLVGQILRWPCLRILALKQWRESVRSSIHMRLRTRSSAADTMCILDYLVAVFLATHSFSQETVRCNLCSFGNWTCYSGLKSRQDLAPRWASEH